MPDHPRRPDLAARALGGLDAAEDREIDAHLASCDDCRGDWERMHGVAVLARAAAPPLTLPPGMEGRVMAALDAARAGAGGHAPIGPDAGGRSARRARTRRWTRSRPAIALAAVAAALVAGTVVATRALEGGGPAGTLEIRTDLRGAATASASATVRRTALGRTVVIRSDTLPILPTGSFYEVWFVASDDRPDARDRISAGTFHPDDAGHTDVLLHAAVDPRLFPVISITSEPADGDPDPGAEVLSSGR